MKYISLTILFLMTITLIAQEPDPGFPPPPPTDTFNEQPTTPAENLTNKLDQIPTMSDEDRQKISDYLDEALENYEDILAGQPAAERETNIVRIENNERLAQDYEQRLAQCEARLRKIKNDYLRQYEALKNSRATGKIDQKIYDMKLQKILKEYRANLNETLKDKSYLQEQGQKANERLAALKEIKRINDLLRDEDQVMVDDEEAEAQRPPAHELDAFLLEIRQTQCFEIKNFCTSPEFK